MAEEDTPLLAVTLGDPAGIGPEIVARTLAAPPADARALGVAVGDAGALREAVRRCGLEATVTEVGHPAEARDLAEGTIAVIDVGGPGEDVAWGRVSAEAGRSAVAAIEAATRLALDGTVAGVVTAPIHKEAIWAAGATHLGHTEMLAALTGRRRGQTMFLVRGLAIFFTTRHLALRDAVAGVTREAVGEAIAEAWQALRVLGHDEPRLAVSALNPHGGEGGNFGDEELTAIGPACDDARAAGMPVAGPVPADAVFHQGLEGRYDAVLCHLHDQGHIAAKSVDFDGTVSVTLGLPILRTSVDHGTAFDIAGAGTAGHGTLSAAYRAAADLAPRREALRLAYPPG